MQKVEGSSPFSRFGESPANRGAFVVLVTVERLVDAEGQHAWMGSPRAPRPRERHGRVNPWRGGGCTWCISRIISREQQCRIPERAAMALEVARVRRLNTMVDAATHTGSLDGNHAPALTRAYASLRAQILSL
jgi:hypothetical protein